MKPSSAAEGSQPNASLSVVMPVHDRPAELRQAFEALRIAAASESRIDVTLVMHHPTAAVREYLAGLSLPSGFRIIESHASTIGSARNDGAADSLGTVLVFLDADVMIEPHYFSVLRHRLAATGADALGFEYYPPPGGRWHERAWFALNVVPELRDVTYINAGNFAVHRESFLAVGGFSPTLVTGEDVDLCRRLVTAGFRVVADPELRSVHLGNPKSLLDFYRRQRWHGGEVLAGLRLGERPALLTILHTLLLLVALLLLLVPSDLRVGGRLLAAVLAIVLVPLAALVYRLRRARAVRHIVPGLALFVLYFTARADSLVRAFLGRGRAARVRAP